MVDAVARLGFHDAAMKTTTSTQAFVDHLTARNFEQLARTMAPDAVARFLLPRGAQETAGSDAIARRFQGWFGGADSFIVLSTNHQSVGGRSLIQWRFRLSRDGRSTEVIEQVAFVDEGPDGVSRLDLLCSGFLPADELVADALSCRVPKRGL
jgi:SnoaL-like domain